MSKQVTATKSGDLSSLVEDFLTWLAVERGRSVNTLAAYRRDMKHYFRFLDEHGISLFDATTEDITDFIDALRHDGFAATSARRILASVRGLHRYCVMEELRNDDPATDVESPRHPRMLLKALSADQITAFIDSVTGNDAVARRARALFEVMYGTGCRISELSGMSIADVDLYECLVRFTGKGNKQRIVPLGRHAADALEQWLTPEGRGQMEPLNWARRGDAEAVFLNQQGSRLTRHGIWRIVRQYGNTAGLRPMLTPHVLRHSCATHMLDGGADIRFVQEMLGHASVVTTQLYTKVSNERLWAVYRKAHPRGQARSS